MKKFLTALAKEDLKKAIQYITAITSDGIILNARLSAAEKQYNLGFIEREEFIRTQNQIAYALYAILQKFPKSGKYERILKNNKIDRVSVLEQDSIYLMAPVKEDLTGNQTIGEYSPMELNTIHLFMDGTETTSETLPYIYVGK